MYLVEAVKYRRIVFFEHVMKRKLNGLEKKFIILIHIIALYFRAEQKMLPSDCTTTFYVELPTS